MVDYTAAELVAKEPLLEQCLDRALEEQEFAGASFLLVKDNEELIRLEKGQADLENKKPIRKDSIYRLCSMTKPVTAAAVLHLVEEGRLDLLDPVCRFLPAYAHPKVLQADGSVVPAGREICIRDLLNMTSGLCYGGFGNQAERETASLYAKLQTQLSSGTQMTTQEFAAEAGQLPLLFDPGTSWQYGISADVLGAVIEKVSDQPLDEYLKATFFDPLDMEDTRFVLNQTQQDRLVRAYRRQGDTLVPCRKNYLGVRSDGGPNAFASGGAGLFSTLDDCYRFSQMLMRGGRGMNGNRVLRLGTVQYMTRHGIAGMPRTAFHAQMGLEGFTYSNLLRIMDQPEHADTIGREGEYGWDGWMGTYWCNSPADGITLLLLMNQAGYETGRVTRMIRNIVFG